MRCSACNTRYRVAAAEVPAPGRRLQCAGCGHVWFQAQREVMADQPFPVLAEEIADGGADGAADGNADVFYYSDDGEEDREGYLSVWLIGLLALLVFLLALHLLTPHLVAVLPVLAPVLEMYSGAVGALLDGAAGLATRALDYLRSATASAPV